MLLMQSNMRSIAIRAVGSRFGGFVSMELANVPNQLPQPSARPDLLSGRMDGKNLVVGSPRLCREMHDWGSRPSVEVDAHLPNTA